MNTTASKSSVGRWMVVLAVATTVVVALGAFWLSFSALTDLAARSGIPAHQAWVWPVIVDGMIVMGTAAIVAMSAHEPRARRFPWAVLAGGALVSVSANAAHAVIAGPADAGVPPVVGALVGAAAPLALLVATHMTVTVTRKAAPAKPSRRRRATPPPATVPTSPAPVQAPAQSAPVEAPAHGAGEVAPSTGLRLVAAPGGDGPEDFEAWVRAAVAAGGPISGPAAVTAGVAASESTARRRLRELRTRAPELFSDETDQAAAAGEQG